MLDTFDVEILYTIFTNLQHHHSLQTVGFSQIVARRAWNVALYASGDISQGYRNSIICAKPCYNDVS